MSATRAGKEAFALSNVVANFPTSERSTQPARTRNMLSGKRALALADFGGTALGTLRLFAAQGAFVFFTTYLSLNRASLRREQFISLLELRDRVDGAFSS